MTLISDPSMAQLTKAAATTTTKAAVEAFRNKNYGDALRIYEELKKRYNTNAFDLNIKICSKLLGKTLPKTKRLFQLDATRADLSCLNQFFDKVYLVNLKSEIDSRIRAEFCMASLLIGYSVFEATNGYQGEPLKVYQDYILRPLGKLKRFSGYNEKEIKRGKGFIESAGAIGYIFTYRRILQDAIKNKYKSILILEDDVTFVLDAPKRIETFLARIPRDWKIIHFGSSQYGWNGISKEQALVSGYYHPSILQTSGSFAIGINHSVFTQVIDLASYFEAPFDHLPLGHIYQSFPKKCFSAFPAIAIPDVSKSTIRPSRDQVTHSQRMEWPIEKIEYPLRKPLLQILLNSSTQLKYSSSFKRFYNRGYIVNFYKYSKDGIRPVHENLFRRFDTPPGDQNEFTEIEHQLTKSKLWISKQDNLPFTEEDFHDHLLATIEYNHKEEDISVSSFLEYIPGRASIIIPTHRRLDNLRLAILSCVEQTYHDLEVIVVSDNDDLSCVQQVKQLEKGFKSYSNIKFVYHSENRNGSAARNTGALSSSGEYLFFLDDDDIYLPERVKSSVDLLSSLPSYYGGTYCGYLGWNSPSLDKSRFPEEDLFKRIITLDHKSHYVHTNTVTLRRSAFFSLNGFNEAYRRHQDIEFFLRFLTLYKLKPIKQAFVTLKPNPVPNSNIPSCELLKEIKRDLLYDFSREIAAFGEEFIKKVYNAHNSELLRYSPDKSNLIALPPIFSANPPETY